MKPGDYIQIKTSSETFEGTLMPDSINNKLVIKLKSGYNMGINKSKIKSKKVLKQAKKTKKTTKKQTQSKKLPKILILHTGGTIASKVDYETGGVISKFTPEELLEMFPELKELANIDCKQISNIFSEDMGFKDYNTIAKEIKKAKDISGIIITHGTDTMHYTAAALSFMLNDLPYPVLLVGSQRSSDRPSSDAYMNLLCAVQFIINSEFSEVGICMHSTINDDYCWILPGLKSKKLHTSRRDAFQPINSRPIAYVNTAGKIKYITTKFTKKDPSKKLKIDLLKENLKIGILKVHPNLQPSEIQTYSKFDGLIIEGTGLGHMPINSNPKLLTELKKLKIPIVMCSQTVFGRVNMNVYSTGRKLQEFVLSGSDMTSETAFIKLAWLLSTNQDINLISKNLKGEINETISDEFLFH